MGLDAEVRATVDKTIVEAHRTDIHDHLPELWAEAVKLQQSVGDRMSNPESEYRASTWVTRS